jgi:lysophospholipase L1-like esterase
MPAAPATERRATAEPSLCAMIRGLLRFALAVAALVAALAAASELALRAGGLRPRPPAELARVVPDGWTGFRLRPGVAGEEAVVTNDVGMHAPRSYPLARPPGSLRVAVLGSSVVYGVAAGFADTIPGVVEREFREAGHPAEVLNFGTHGFTIPNVSAQLQAYVHQFQPDAVVVVLDLQVGQTHWPAVRPAEAAADAIEKLGWGRALVRRGSRWSALLTLLDEPRLARRWVRRATGLPLRPPPPATPGGRARVRPSPSAAPSARAGPTDAGGPAAGSPEDLRAYEERRERDLGAALAAMAAFCAEKSIARYFVTPYGPYFDVTEDELAGMTIRGLIAEPTRLRGSEREALRAEVELITRVARRVAAESSAQVIDMLEASRGASLRTSQHFDRDGVHLSRWGNAAVGELIARRVLRDLAGRSRAGG